MEMKAEIGVMLLQAKKCQRLPANQQERGGRQETDSPLTVLRKTQPLPTSSFWTCSLQNCETIRLCCFKPPSLWYFITAAPRNQCISSLPSTSSIKLISSVMSLISKSLLLLLFFSVYFLFVTSSSYIMPVVHSLISLRKLMTIESFFFPEVVSVVKVLVLCRVKGFPQVSPIEKGRAERLKHQAESRACYLLRDVLGLLFGKR